MLANAEQQQAEVQGKIEGAKERIIEVLNTLGLGFTAAGAIIAHPAIREPKPNPPTSSPPRRSFKEQAPEIAKRLGLDKKEFLDAALRPEHVQQLLERLPAKTTRDGRPTEGFWIDHDGTEKYIKNGRGRPFEGGEYIDDLDYQRAVHVWRAMAKRLIGRHFDKMWDLEEASHAELKAIVNMKAANIKHGAIVINHAAGPCQGHITKCRQLIGEYLEKGSTVTIYWPGNSMIFKGSERDDA